MPRRTAETRGQTLLLMGLTLLVLTGMVLTTLNLASRTRGRLEMQTLADVAAYSNAVATARAFNGVSVMNRAALSIYAAEAGAAAMIAYGTQGLSFNRALHQSLTASRCIDMTGSGCCVAHDAAKLAGQTALDTRYNTLMSGFVADDDAANAQLASNQGSVGNLRQAQLTLLLTMEAQIGGGVISERILTEAQVDEAQAGPIKVVNTKAVNQRETTSDLQSSLPKYLFGGPPVDEPDAMGTGAIKYQGGEYNRLMAGWALGTRADWMASYTMSAPQEVSACGVGGFNCTAAGGTGAGYFTGEKDGHGPHDQTYAYGDGEGTATATWTQIVSPPCALVSTGVARNADVKVRTTDAVVQEGMHQWAGSNGQGDEAHRHMLGICVSCPSVWVRPFQFSWDGKGADDVYGQPKNYAAFEKDLTKVVKDPWHRIFSIRMPGEKDPSVWDMRRPTASEAHLQTQYAIGTGLAYYHRDQNWREPPNLMNPFWRAALTHGFIDEQSKATKKSDGDFALIFGKDSAANKAIQGLAGVGHAAMEQK